jgi:hypothetical protein
MKGIWLSVGQLALLAAMYASFFALTVWLGCRPLAELTPEQRMAKPVPQDAVCYTDNHGRLAFYPYGLISRDPVRFALNVAGVLVPFGILLLITPRKRKLPVDPRATDK